MYQSNNVFRRPKPVSSKATEQEIKETNEQPVSASDRIERTEVAPIDSSQVSQVEAVIKIRKTEGVPLVHDKQVFVDDEEPNLLIDIDEHVDKETAFPGLQKVYWLGVCMLIVLGCSTLLLICTQTAILAREISSWPGPASYLGYFSLTALWIAVLAAIAQLVYQFARLKESPSLSLSAINDLELRKVNRGKGIKSQKFAVETLRNFLRDYPADRTQLSLLKRVRLRGKNSASKELLQCRDELIGSDNGVSSQWLERARKDFFIPIDEAADRLIREYGIKIGSGTALSPRGSVDSIIVLAGMYKMIGDLCQLYNVRPGALGIAIVLGQSLLAAIFAIGTDEAADQLEGGFREFLTGALGNVGSIVAAKVATRVAEGTANGLFVWRVGQRLKSRLRPLGD